ncbi:MAG: hypothetical protein KatS3mg095_0444 [Candidatus Parcubacteria bacterium]|nr:MAG: hypothetical protein KatS3mg095_0444 [Candidatus Parcubacteria bacterium]
MNLKKFLFPILIVFSLFFLFYGFKYLKSAGVTIKAFVPGVCGNNLKEPGEECDDPDLGGQSCVSLGYSGGTLSCNSNCTFNTSQCITQPPPSGGGGGGGGSYVPSYGTVIFSGRAQPNSNVTLMSDGQIRSAIKVDADGKFKFTLSNLTPGNYIFTLYSEDIEGRRTSLHSIPAVVTAGLTIEIGNIFLSPTIDIDKTQVKRGEILRIFGQTAPESNVLIVVSSEEELYFQTQAEKDGSYLYAFNTIDLDYGQHLTKSRSILANQLVSPFSRALAFQVSTSSIAKKPTKCPLKGDLNNDCRVNLIDFSIAAYWYKRKLNSSFANIEKEKLNGDGKVDLVDFSIMAYWWSG